MLWTSLLIVVLLIANDPANMCPQHNGQVSNVLVALTTVLMVAAAATLVVTRGG